MERVGIFYQEFMGVYYFEMWVYFVVEFGLDLIEVQWQLFIGVQFVVDQIGNDFFVGWVEDEWMIVVIGNV